MNVLIDGDILVYRVGFSSEDISAGLAKARLTKLVNSLVLRCNGDSFKVFITGSGKQFRHDVAVTKPYKGNRKALRPKHYEALREHLLKRFNAQVSVYEEADDMLGYTACELLAKGQPCVIVSIDKDLRMIPGDHFNYVKGQYDTVTKAQARLNFYKQLVTGDPTDNIPGYGRGAAKLIQTLTEEMTENELYSKVLGAYEERFGSAAVERLLEVATLLWIRREPNQQWKPPSESFQGYAQKRKTASRNICSR